MKYVVAISVLFLFGISVYAEEPEENTYTCATAETRLKTNDLANSALGT